MLERTYQTVNILPQVYPFNRPYILPPDPSASPPTWCSATRSAYKREYVPGPVPTLPPIVNPDGDRNNNPQPQNAYHIWNIGNKRVCDVTSILSGSLPAGPLAETVTHTSYLPHDPGRGKRHKPMSNSVKAIVPLDDKPLATLSERLLPACNRPKVAHMSTAVQFTGRKKKNGAPYGDGGIFYGGVEQPKGNVKLYGSISSLQGHDFSRRRCVQGPPNKLSLSGQWESTDLQLKSLRPTMIQKVRFATPTNVHHRNNHHGKDHHNNGLHGNRQLSNSLSSSTTILFEDIN